MMHSIDRMREVRSEQPMSAKIEAQCHRVIQAIVAADDRASTKQKRAAPAPQRDKVLTARAKAPTATAHDIAASTGVSLGYVQEIFREENGGGA